MKRINVFTGEEEIYGNRIIEIKVTAGDLNMFEKIKQILPKEAAGGTE